MSKVKAAEYVMEWNGTAIAAGTDYSLEINGEEIDISTLDSGKWKRILGGLMSWTGSLSGMVERGPNSSFFAFVEHMTTNGNAIVTLALKATVEGDKYLTGQALLTNLSKSGAGAGGQEIITYSASFSGDDAILVETLPITP
jgi:predicted secreted protein